MRATIERTLTILESLAKEQGVTPKDFAQRSGLPLSTVYRYFSVLVDRGFANKGEETYTAGIRLSLLAEAPNPYNEFASLSRSMLEELQARTGETVFLCVRSNAFAIALEVVDSQDRLKLTMTQGESLPLYASAPSKILLAYAPADFRERYLRTVDLRRLASQTIVDREELRRQIDAIRATGQAMSIAEVDEFATAIAFPILEPGETARLSLAISGPTSRFGPERIENLLAATSEAADAIARNYRKYIRGFQAGPAAEAQEG